MKSEKYDVICTVRETTTDDSGAEASITLGGCDRQKLVDGADPMISKLILTLEESIDEG